MPSTGNVPNKTTIHASQLADDQRMVLESIMQNMKTNLMATITLLPQDMEAAHLVTKFMQSPAAQFQGSQVPSTLKSATSQYVGVFCDEKMSGEASHRPALRMPPLQYENYERFMRLMMRRHGSVGEEEEEEKDLPQSDI